MKAKKQKNEQIIVEESPLKNYLTIHLLLYISAVILILWDMSQWNSFFNRSVQDRFIVMAVWGIILFMHYCYTRFSTTIDLLRKALQTNQIDTALAKYDKINDFHDDYNDEDEAPKVKRLSN